MIRPEAVAAEVERHVGAPVTDVVSVSGSVANHDFLVRCGEEGFVLKAGPGTEMAAEAWACRRVRADGVLAPEIVVLESDPQGFSLPYLIMKQFPGDNLKDSDHGVLIAAGQDLRRAHEISLAGFGPLHGGSDANTSQSPAGRCPSWSAFLDETHDHLAVLLAAGVIEQTVSRSVTAAYRAHAGQIVFAGPGRLLHGDLKLPHVFAEAGRYVGLIDWGDASVGDPLFDLARFSMGDADSLRSLLEGYGLASTPQTETIFAFYRMVWNTRALRYEFDAGGDWFDTYRSRMITDAARLSRSGESRGSGHRGSDRANGS